MELKEAIKTRRSIRHYKTDDVPDDLIKEIFEYVKMSPSWANTQCWEFIVVKNRETIKKLAETMPERNPATKAVLQAPVLIVQLGKRGAAGFKKGEPVTDKGDWYMYDCGISMQTLCLAAHDMGLGTVIIGYFDAKKAKEILGVPEGVEVVAMTPLGYPESVPNAPKRKEVDDFVFYEKYKY